MKKVPKPTPVTLVLAVILWALAVLMVYLAAKLPEGDTFLPIFWAVLFSVASGSIWSYYFAWRDAYKKRESKRNAS